MYKVCFADDEPIVCQVMANIVDWDRLSYQIAGTASDGQEALELYERTKPDLMIMDIKMPVMDGLECMRHIREKDKKVHIILLTAVDSFESAQRALNLGANGYLLKPVNRAEINRLVEKLTAERGAQRESSRGGRGEQLSRELHSLCAAGEGGAEIDWDASALAQGNDGLLDLFYRPGPQQTEEAISAEVERLTEFLDGLGVKVDGLWREPGRVVIAAPALPERLHTAIASYLSHLPGGAVWLVYELSGPAAPLGPEQLARMLRLNRTHSFYGTQTASHMFLTGEEGKPEAWQTETDAMVFRLLQGADTAPLGRFLDGVFEESAAVLASPHRLQSLCCDLIMKLQSQMERIGFPGEETDQAISPEIFFSCKTAQELRHCTLSAADRLLYGIRQQEDYSRNRAIILKANAFALERYTDPSFSLEETAEFVGLSKNYFTRFYSRETGTGFWAYVTRLRIDRAKLLLETSSLPMAEICARVGYDDVSYFSHRFKSLEGMSPRKFRETHLFDRENP